MSVSRAFFQVRDPACDNGLFVINFTERVAEMKFLLREVKFMKLQILMCNMLLFIFQFVSGF